MSSHSSNKILCKDYPSDFILDKNLAKEYFRQFGKLKRVIFKSKSRICTVEYQEEEGFQNALRNAGEYKGTIFSLTAAHKSPERKRKKGANHDDPIWVDKEEVQAELEAMSGGSSRNYNLPTDSTNILKETKNLERLPKMKRVWQSEDLDNVKKKIKVLESKSMVISAEQMDLVNLILSQALNVEDKYRILDARDKLIRIKLKKKIHLKSSPTIGTCPDMCPEKERMMREAQHQVSLYEQEDNSRAMNQCKAVKQYSRSSADQETPLPHELRPVPVLQMTMNYLLHNIVDLCDTDEVNLAEWFHFLWDRTRGIRKDITQQELCCQGSVELVEQCARFHIHCSARLVAEDPSVFDQKINTENLTKCLQTLKYMYHDLLLKGENCPNEAEFRAYIILLNISDGNFMWEVQQLREDVQKSVEVKYALEVYSAIDKNNYVKFFKLVYSTTYLNACILMRYFTQVRIAAIKTLLRCYLPRSSRTTYPLIDLKILLAFDDVQSTMDFIQTYGLSMNEENTHVILEKNSFATPDFPYVLDRSLIVVESKRSFSVGRIICGKGLQPKIYENHSPQNSFDQNGFLVCKDILEESELEQAKLKLLMELKGEILSSDEDSTKMIIPRQKPIPSGLTTSNIFSKNEIPCKDVNVFEQLVEPVSTSFRSSQSIFVNHQQNYISSQLQPDLAVRKKDFQIPFHDLEVDPSISTNIFSKPSETLMPTIAVSQVNSVCNLIPSSEKKAIDEASLITSQTVPQKVDMFQAAFPRPESYRSNMVISSSHNAVIESVEIRTKPMDQKKQFENERQRLEVIKKEEEMQLLKAKRRDEKLRELKKRRQEEELEERMKKLQREEETLRDVEIIKDVKDTIDSMIDQVHRKLSNERMVEIKNNIKRRIVLKVFKLWHNIVLKNKRTRKVMEYSPVWINTESLEQCAVGLHIPSRNLALRFMERYKHGKPLEIRMIGDDTVSKINIFELTYSALTKRLYEVTGKFHKSIFWKVSVSIPNEQEIEQGLERMEHVLNRVFQWKQQNGRTYVIEQVKQDHVESMTYCIERQKGEDVNVYDANGFIFIAKDFSYDLQRRICENLKGFGVLTKIPIVLILQNYDNTELKLNALIEQKAVSECIILVENITQSSLSNAIEEGLVFLAKRVEKCPPLELDTFHNFLLRSVCSEIWIRAESFAKWNSQYKTCLQNPNVVIKLYNEGLQKLKKIILNESLKEYAVFPKMFTEYLSSDIPDFLPCSYQYFPEFWNSRRYKKKLENLFLDLSLPLWRETWPCYDEVELEKTVRKYCCEVFRDHEKVFYKVMSIFLETVDPEVNFKDITKVLWTDVIGVLGVEKINEVDTSLRDTEFENKSIYNQFIVVYDTRALNSFNSNDWFYIQNPVIKSFINQELKEDENQLTEKIQPNDLETLEETLIVTETRLSMLKPNKLKVMKDLADLNALLLDLENSMEIHKKISSKLDENLKSAIEDN
ncbi:unnamed protein product [Phaedon cochleariae]|uniref:Germinal-center associated nuclear protein n=1 Tax=Phaedon cochleariae TaxID=80249 RepID=A0A9P0D7U5_PHACE|nr:unnamed protein product [Phaedon cochleariae]